MGCFILITIILMEQIGWSTQYLLDGNHVLTGAPNVNSTETTAIIGKIDACADKTNCTAFTNQALCYTTSLMYSAAKLCPKTCAFCSSCIDEDNMCNFMKNVCDTEIVQQTCPRSCGKCTDYDPATFLNNYKTTVLPTAAKVTTTTAATTAALLSNTSLPALQTKACDKFGVIAAVLHGSVITSSTSSPCSDGIHHPPEAVIQNYCSAPSMTKWMPGVKVLDNCDRLPHYIPVAARSSDFGGSTMAAVLINCEHGGFQAAMQTCNCVIKIYHVSMNSTSEIPSADKFVVLNWNN